MMKSPCDTCQKVCSADNGYPCIPWRKWFVDYWNRNIYIGPKPRKRESFRYEHPDLRGDEYAE